MLGLRFRDREKCQTKVAKENGIVSDLLTARVLQATLGRGASLEQWAGWLEACVRQALAPHERRADYTARARRLLLDWSFYSSLVIRELTLR